MDQDVRWKQRLNSFERVFARLTEAVQADLADRSDLELEGLIQRFEFTFELAWKTMKDFLEYSGLVIEPAAPRNVIKLAVEAGMLSSGDVWIEMLNARNLLTHTYDENLFRTGAADIKSKFHPAMAELYTYFRSRART